ncbi:endonuclease [Halocella sp. SP3-1]|nr:endonuclease [Halocella sp. SP3-1]
MKYYIQRYLFSLIDNIIYQYKHIELINYICYNKAQRRCPFMKKYSAVLIIVVIIVIVTVYMLNISNKSAVLVSSNITTRESTSSIKIMTYNIQHGRGINGKLALDRIAGVIKDSGADIVGLNEVDQRQKRSNFVDQVAYLAERLDMNYVFGPTLKGISGNYGNAILSRFPIESAENYLLTSKNSEARALLTTEVNLSANKSITVFVTHLSIEQQDRKQQMEEIEDYISQEKDSYILMGDFNKILDLSFGLTPLISGLKSFPADLPSEEIDLFFASQDITLKEAKIINTKASDHLPVVIDIDITA